MGDFAIECDGFDRAMCAQQDGPARRFVTATRLHADIAVLDEIEPANAVRAADFVQGFEQRRRRQALAVERDRIALFEFDVEHRRPVGRRLRRHAPAPHGVFRRRPRIFEHAAFIGNMQQVRVHRVRRLRARLVLDRNAVLLRIGQQRFARGQVPFAPRRDHADVGHQRIGAEFETHLVIALARRAVGNRVRACHAHDLDETLGDQRPRDRRAEQVLAFIDRVRAEHREHEVADEFFAQVVDEDLLDPHQLGLAAGRFEFLTLADVGGEGDDLAVIGFLQPFENDRGVQAAGIGEHDFLDGGFGHGDSRCVAGRGALCRERRGEANVGV